MVEHDALFMVEHAGALIDLADNRLETKKRDLVGYRAPLSIEGFPFPSEDADEFRDLSAKLRSRRNDGCALGFAVGNWPGRTAGEHWIQLRLRHLQQLVYIRSHVDQIGRA